MVKNIMNKFIAGIIILFSCAPAPASELLMIEEQGCYWCALWTQEIAPKYPKTAAGKYAPLRKVDIDALPKEISLTRAVMFTPTFILVNENEELARIEGYPGEDFFWPLLENALSTHTTFKEEKP